MKTLRIMLLLLFPLTALAAGGSNIPLQKAHINFDDKASLQRGAALYMNYCLGCHSLKYVRYNKMAKQLGILNAQGQVDEALIKENLIMDKNQKVGDIIEHSMPIALSKQWFGVTPPDLSLITRVRGDNWIYTYLMSFYSDPSRPWGANNLLFKDVGMPNILGGLQGEQVPVYAERNVKYNGKTTDVKYISHLKLIKDGSMTSAQFKVAVNDLVNFLAFVANPVKHKMHVIGTWVIIFLLILLVLVYLVKREYWKDIK